jgi:hypothetical protein
MKMNLKFKREDTIAFSLVFSSLIFTLFVSAMFVMKVCQAFPMKLHKISVSIAELSQFQSPFAADAFGYKFLLEVAQLTEMGRSNAKPEIIRLLREIQTQGAVIRKGKDADVRPPFVGAQAEFERELAHLLSAQQISHLVSIIHTPTPATPLCTKGEISPELVDPSLLQDERRLYTVKERPQIIREYLEKGGLLYIAYPQGGREKRTVEQLEIYDAEREKYPHNLIDVVLNCNQLDREMSGATYLFKSPKGGWMAFAIMASQANAPQDDQAWGIWFGSLTHPEVRQRVEDVLSYLINLEGPDILAQLIN